MSAICRTISNHVATNNVTSRTMLLRQSAPYIRIIHTFILIRISVEKQRI